MDQPSSDELNLIQDPENGLALLTKRPAEETPAQELQRLFWEAQFTHWRDKAAETPPGDALIVLLQQVEPGRRLRAAVALDANLLPLPDNEAVVHTLFEVAMGREALPPDWQALSTLIKKYTMEPGQ